MTKMPLLACLTACLLPFAASAQSSYPDRPIRLVVPFAPGGVTDTSGRVIAEALSKRLGQQVIVENKAGASGNIGTQGVATAPPDGYTLVLGFDGTLAGRIQSVQGGVTERGRERVGGHHDTDQRGRSCLRPHPVSDSGEEKERNERLEAVRGGRSRTVDHAVELGLPELIAKTPVHRS